MGCVDNSLLNLVLPKTGRDVKPEVLKIRMEEPLFYHAKTSNAIFHETYKTHKDLDIACCRTQPYLLPNPIPNMAVNRIGNIGTETCYPNLYRFSFQMGSSLVHNSDHLRTLLQSPTFTTTPLILNIDTSVFAVSEAEVQLVIDMMDIRASRFLLSRIVLRRFSDQIGLNVLQMQIDDIESRSHL